tara:strand:- start:3441 stop:3896 length:456 start_codon:yes stop_codon:yes gene_type:complete
MVFKSDNQRKAVMSKLNNKSRSNIKPSIIGKIKGFEQKVEKRLRERKERKGRERIQKELKALKRERKTAERLSAELEVEKAREEVAKQRRVTQAEFTRIEKERFARTKAGRAVALARAGARRGIQKIREEAKKKPKKRARQETGFFGAGYF